MDLKRRQYLEAQLSAYLDGELNAAERAEVEAFLASDADASKLLAELEATVAGLRALPRAKVSPDLMEGLRSRLERRALLGDQPSRTPSTSTLPFSGRWLAAAAVVAMMVTAGYVMYSFRSPEPTLRGKDFALQDSGVHPADRLTEGETRMLLAPSAGESQEKAKDLAAEGRQSLAKDRTIDATKTIDVPAAATPRAMPSKGERTVATPKAVAVAPGRSAGETVVGAGSSGVRPAEPATIVADADGIIDRAAKLKGDQAGLTVRDETVAKIPAENKKSDLGDKVVVATDDHAGVPSTSGSLRGMPAEEQLRARMPRGGTQPAARPAAQQPQTPVIAEYASKGKLESERPLTRGEGAAPSAPAMGQAKPGRQLVREDRKASTAEHADATPNAAVSVDKVAGPPATERVLSEKEQLALGTDFESRQSIGGVGGGGRTDLPAQSGQRTENREGLGFGAPMSKPDDGLARGFGGGMGGFGGYQESFGRSRRGGVAADERDEARNRGVLSDFYADGRTLGAFLFAMPLRGEPPWRPDDNAPADTSVALGAAGSSVGKPPASDMSEAAKAGNAQFKYGKELGEVTTGGRFAAGRRNGQAADGQPLGPPALSGAERRPATQPASAPATAPASQPANPPAKPPSQAK